jgi:hypothetical protein
MKNGAKSPSMPVVPDPSIDQALTMIASMKAYLDQRKIPHDLACVVMTPEVRDKLHSLIFAAPSQSIYIPGMPRSTDIATIGGLRVVVIPPDIPGIDRGLMTLGLSGLQ